MSITAYTFTLLWLLGFVRRDTRWRARTVSAAAWEAIAAIAAWRILRAGPVR